jgi:pyruvate-formate lyase-activating enzyme
LKYEVIPTSFVDSPNAEATVVFCDECNMDCWYCHQKEYLHSTKGTLTRGDVLNKVKSLERENLQTGRVEPTTRWLILSGGEPSLHDENELVMFKGLAKQTGRFLGIWTNGFRPIPHDLFEWVNFDYKYRFDDLAEEIDAGFFCGLTLANNIFYRVKHDLGVQISTTLIRGKHTNDYVYSMATDLMKVLKYGPKRKLKWRLASFKEPVNFSSKDRWSSMNQMPDEEVRAIADLIRPLDWFEPIAVEQGLS